MSGHSSPDHKNKSECAYSPSPENHAQPPAQAGFLISATTFVYEKRNRPKSTNLSHESPLLTV